MKCSYMDVVFVCHSLIQLSTAGIFGPANDRAVFSNEDDWEPVYRIYAGQSWDSHDDYLSKERSARYGNHDDSQFRSWKLEQWHHSKIHKVRVELYDNGDEVAEFEFDGTMQNITSFFSSKNLRKSTYTDIPLGQSDKPFSGDMFRFEGDDDSRHWTISSRHVGDCKNDDGWFQIIDKPKPGRDRCVCGYENVDRYPTIMYAKGNRKTKWSDKYNVGHADMMQISLSHKPYPEPQIATSQVQVQAVQQPIMQAPVQPQLQQQIHVQHVYPFEFKK